MEFITSKVACRGGTIDKSELSTLQAAFNASARATDTLANHVALATLLGSHTIWFCRDLLQ